MSQITAMGQSGVAPGSSSLNRTSSFALAGQGSLIALSQSRCRAFALSGPEDVAIDYEKGVAYISSQARSRGLFGSDGPTSRGAIYALDLRSSTAQPVDATAKPAFGSDNFHPLGIDLFVAQDGRARLFVINRLADGSRVEVFDVIARETGALRHLRTVGPEKVLTDPNDLAALSLDEFYLTNEHAGSAKTQVFIEEMLGLHGGSVIHCKMDDHGDVELKVVAKGFATLSGIAVDPNTRPATVYVSPFWTKKVFVYRRADDGDLVKTEAEIVLPGGADNLTLDASGSLWIGADPDSVAMIAYFSGDRDISPSLVLRVPDPKAGKPVVERIFVDDGALISASSVAAYYEGKSQKLLLVGAPFQDRLLVLDLT